MYLLYKIFTKELTKVAINKPQEDHKLLGTARALRLDQASSKAVTKSSPHLQGTGGWLLQEMCRKFFRKIQLCTVISALADNPFVKGSCWVHKKSSEELTREPIHRIARQTDIVRRSKRVHVERSISQLLRWGLSRLLCSGLHRQAAFSIPFTKRDVHKESSIFDLLIDHTKCSRFATNCNRLALDSCTPEPITLLENLRFGALGVSSVSTYIKTKQNKTKPKGKRGGSVISIKKEIPFA